MKTETNLKQNCFETVLFQFHFSCADSLSAPTYDKTSRLASADFRRRYSISCISRPLTELTQSIKLTTHGWRFQISLDGREFDWHCQGTTTSIRFCEIVCRCPGTRLVRTSAIVCWTVRLNLTSPRGINIFLHSASSNQLDVPSVKLSTYRACAFSCSGPAVWRSMNSEYLRDSSLFLDVYRRLY